MPKVGFENYMPKPREQAEAERAGREALRAYCDSRRGVQAALCRKTNILPSQLCRIISGKTVVTLEAALLLEVATEGAVPAESLCPSRAELMKQLIQLRTGA